MADQEPDHWMLSVLWALEQEGVADGISAPHRQSTTSKGRRGIVSDLRQQAVEALDRVLEDDDVRADVVADRALAAAEPFIRALVVQEIVAHLNGAADLSSLTMQADGFRRSAELIENTFGGIDA